jgi:hypothetical protein
LKSTTRFSSGRRGASPYSFLRAAAGKDKLQAGKYHALFESAFMLDPDSETYKLADQIFAGIVEGSDANIGNLFVSYIRDGGSAEILAPDDNDVISDSSTGSNFIDDMVDEWNGEDKSETALAGDSDTGYNGITEGAGELIDGITITDGKVGGKIPIDEFKTIRQSSIKNPDADSITLGKYTNGLDSYIAKAGGNSSYFDMGSNFDKVMKEYDLSYDEMFEYFNKPVLNDAISSGKTIRFSHDPRLYETGFIVDEWEYIKSTLKLTDTDLVFEGGFWIVK